MLNQLCVFHGAASDAEARIYVRAARDDWPADARLSGQIIGPDCDFSQTLPATIRLADCGPGETLLAQAIVPDPCCWTPELPFLYRARVELRQGDALLASAERLFGVRRLGVHGRNLIYNAKRWVLRGIGIAAAEIEHGDSVELRALAATLVVTNPSDAICEHASRQGLQLLADLSQFGVTERIMLVGELQRLAQWPAVGMALLPNGANLPANVQRLAPNLLLAEAFPADRPASPSPWASVAMCEVGAIESFAQRLAACRLPCIAASSLPSESTAAQQRASCDRLQAALAAIGDCAGYVVNASQDSTQFAFFNY